MHRSDVLGGRERAEVDSEHRLRVLALEGVRGPGKSPAQTHLNARHGSQEPNNRASHELSCVENWELRAGVEEVSHFLPIV